MSDNYKCPICEYALVRKHEGLVCRNFKCKLYFKLGRGWVLLKPTERQEENEFICERLYNFKLGENAKRWMELKKEVLFEQDYTCQFCKSDVAVIVHHIIPVHVEPIFTLDKDNLILACQDCHDKLHLNDKHRFNKYGNKK